MDKKYFNNFRKEIQDNMYNWVLENFHGWDEFIEWAFVDGKEFYIPTKLIPPATLQEWNEASVGGSYTDGLIEVTDCSIRGFCVLDGHNRLKTYLNKGVEQIKVIYRD